MNTKRKVPVGFYIIAIFFVYGCSKQPLLQGVDRGPRKSPGPMDLTKSTPIQKSASRSIASIDLKDSLNESNEDASTRFVTERRLMPILERFGCHILRLTHEVNVIQNKVNIIQNKVDIIQNKVDIIQNLDYQLQHGRCRRCGKRRKVNELEHKLELENQKQTNKLKDADKEKKPQRNLEHKDLKRWEQISNLQDADKEKKPQRNLGCPFNCACVNFFINRFM